MIARLLLILCPLLALLAACSAERGRVEEDVRRGLRDPESAQFRDLRACAKPGAWQGEVNSKNGYGGYAGFRPFIWAGGEVAILGSEEPGPLAVDPAATMNALDQWDKLTRLCWADDIINKIEADMGDLPAPDDASAQEAAGNDAQALESVNASAR
jgi:hypothetical protein